MKNLMKIINARLVQSDKRARIAGGVYIKYLSNDNVTKSYVEIEFEGVKHYFETTDVSIDGDNLMITAVEVGYWATKFDKNIDFDLRNLVGLELSEISDLGKISKINEMSCWC